MSSKYSVTGAVCNSAQVDRIVGTPSRAIHMIPRVNVEVFSSRRCSHSSFAKWLRNIEPFNTAIDISQAQDCNLTSFCTDKISVKSLSSEFVTDLDPSKQMNFASSDLGESPKFLDFGLLSVNAMGKPNSVLAPSTRADSLNSMGGGQIKQQLSRV